jgi:hypothetical protein
MKRIAAVITTLFMSFLMSSYSPESVMRLTETNPIAFEQNGFSAQFRQVGKDLVEMSFEQPAEMKFKLELERNGTTLRKATYKKEEGRVQFDISALPAGSYDLHIKSTAGSSKHIVFNR